MIIDAIVGVFLSVLAAVLGGLLAVVPTPPVELVTVMSEAWELGGKAYALDHWLPIDLAFILAAAVLAAYAVMVTVGIVRLIVSYFTLGSGAT